MRFMQRVRTYLLSGTCGILFITLGCTLAPTVWIEESRSESFAANNVSKLDFRTHNGTLKATGYAQESDGLEQISIAITIKSGGASPEDAKACQQALQISLEVVDGVLIGRHSYTTPKKKNWRTQISYDIQHPNSVALHLRTHNGPITVANTLAATNLKTHNGSIDAENVSATLTLRTHNGPISARNCQGVWQLQTHNGPIAAEGSSQKIVARTHNGPVDVALGNSGAIDGEIRTHNGSVDLKLADSALAQISCKVYNGKFDVGPNYTIISRSKRNLKVERGSAIGSFKVKTHSGSIRLQ